MQQHLIVKAVWLASVVLVVQVLAESSSHVSSDSNNTTINPPEIEAHEISNQTASERWDREKECNPCNEVPWVPMAPPPGLTHHHKHHNNHQNVIQDSYGPPPAGAIHSTNNFGPQPLSEHYPPENVYGPPPPPKEIYGPPKPSIDQYGPPKPPNDHYGPPKPPSDHYGPPKSPSDHFGPQKPPIDHYGPPKLPGDLFGPPKPPSDHYGPPKSPSGHFGPPKPPSDHYGPPKIPFKQYGPPQPLNEIYGPPKLPNDQYGPPSLGDHYGPPKLTSNILGPPNDQYGPPKPPSDQYGPPIGDHYGPPKPPSGGDSDNFGPPKPLGNIYGPPKPPGEIYGPPPPIPLDFYKGPKPIKPPSDIYGGPPPPPFPRKPWNGGGIPPGPRFGVKVNYPSEYLVPPPGDSLGSHSDKRPAIQRPPPIPLQPPPPPPGPNTSHPPLVQNQLHSNEQHHQHNQQQEQHNQVQQNNIPSSDNDLEIVKSVQVAGFLSSVEYPLEIYQSQSYIDVPTNGNAIQTGNEIGGAHLSASQVIGSSSGVDSSDNDKEGEIIMGKPFPGGPVADAPSDHNSALDQKEASSQVEQASAPSSLSLSSSSSSGSGSLSVSSMTSVTIEPSIQTSQEHLQPPPPPPHATSIINFGPSSHPSNTIVHLVPPQSPSPPGFYIVGNTKGSGTGFGISSQGGTKFHSSAPGDIQVVNDNKQPPDNLSSGPGTLNLHANQHQQQLHHNQHASTALGGTIVHSGGGTILSSNSIVPEITVSDSSLQTGQLIHTINGLPASAPVGYVPFQSAPQLPPAPFSFLNPPVTTAATSDYTSWTANRHHNKESKDIHQVIIPYTTSQTVTGDAVASSSSSSSSVINKQHLLRFRFLNDEHKQAINTAGWAPVEEEITVHGPAPLNCSHIFGENRRKQWRKGRLCIGFHGDSDEQESRPSSSKSQVTYKNGKTLHEVLANNIRELLRSETTKGSKPPTIDKLRTSIDNWTVQSYKRLHGSTHEQTIGTTIGYSKSLPHLRLPSKTIPDEFLTTEPSIFDDEPRTENTIATAVPADPEHSASGSEWNAVLESNFVESDGQTGTATVSPNENFSYPLLDEAEAEAATTDLPNVTPSSIDTNQWVSLSVRQKEKVFVVTPQPGNLINGDLSNHRHKLEPIPEAIHSPGPTTSHPPLSINDVFPFRQGSDSGATSPSRFAVRPAPLPRVGSNSTTESLPTYTPPAGTKVHTDAGHSRVVTATSSPRTRTTRGLSPEDDDDSPLDDLTGFDEDDSNIDEDSIVRLQSLELHKNKH